MLALVTCAFVGAALRGVASVDCNLSDFAMSADEAHAQNVAALVAFYTHQLNKDMSEARAREILHSHHDVAYLEIELSQKYGSSPQLTPVSVATRTLMTVEQVRAVGAAGCRTLDSLRVSCANCTDTDLDAGFGALRRLRGPANEEGMGLEFFRCHLVTSLRSLSQLAGTLPGSMYIGKNDRLSSLDGLQGITSIAAPSSARQHVARTASSRTSESLSSARACSVSVSIQMNRQLTSISALRGLTGTLPGALAIGGNAKLPSLGGLHGLTSLGADCDNNSLIIWGTGALRDLAGLRGVEGALPGALRVGENRALRSLQGLEGVNRVGRDHYDYSLFVWDNPQLRTVAGLAGLRGHDYGTLRFKRNPKLRSLKGVGGVQSCLKTEVDVEGGESCKDHNCLVRAGLFEETEGVRHREM